MEIEKKLIKNENEIYLTLYCKEKLEKLEDKLYYERINFYFNKVKSNKINFIQFEKNKTKKEQYERLYNQCVFKNK